MNTLYILLALLIFGVLIFIHELGHFIAARLCGVKVLEFAIGMGPKIFSVRSKKSGTLYSVRLIPIGGYVSMLGENGMETVQGSSDYSTEAGSGQNDVNSSETGKSAFINDTNDFSGSPAAGDRDAQQKPQKDPIDEELAKQAYCNKSVWKRILISLAGPLMNLLLGFVMMIVIVASSGQNAVGTTQIGGFYFQYTGAGEENGMQTNDYLSYVNGVQINDFSRLSDIIKNDSDGLFSVTVLRQDEKGYVSEIHLSDVPLDADFIKDSFTASLSSQKLQVGDIILKINSTRVHTYHELGYEIMHQGYKPMRVTVLRNGEELVLEDVIVPSSVDEKNNITFGDVDFKVYGEENFNIGTILKHAWYRSVSTVKMVYDSLIGLFSGRYGVSAISGPVGITKTISDVAKTGVLNVIYLVVVISINLGIMNLLPLPALDGGHLLLYFIEVIRRKPIKQELEGMINFIGLVLMLALAVVIAIKDIISL